MAQFCIFKTLHNWHWTPTKLRGAGMLHHCWRCTNDNCDLIHILCECPSIQTYWLGIGRVLHEIVPVEIPIPKPPILLHDMEAYPDISRPQRRLLHTALATAKICIPRHWRSPIPPSQEEWHTAMVQTATYERVIYNLQDQTDISPDLGAISTGECALNANHPNHSTAAVRKGIPLSLSLSPSVKP